ncbi:hypothetical protein [Neptunicella sp.]|uniref:hypothetical protein n=1 Tax=Neptunicella sp. TaxID=2125986 RepID=UPI003F692B92
MDILRINKLANMSALTFSVALMAYMSFAFYSEKLVGTFLIGLVATVIPILLATAGSNFFLKRTQGITSIFIFCAFFVVVLTGCCMYLYFFFFPSDKATGLEFLLIPISQLMALPFAALLGMVLKNNVKIT